MKNNTKEIKENLEKILRMFPEDFCLNEVKNYIRMAISKIKTIEEKRTKREEKRIKRKENQKYKKNSLLIIDSLIKAEQEKIEKMENI